MFNIVVISRNQKEDLINMVDALGELSSKAIFVLDRCHDGSKRFLKSKGLKYVCTPWYWTGRHTSSCRNLGLKYCDPDSDVLFLDGDRYPVEGKLCFSYWKKDIALLMLEKDHRRKWKFYDVYYGQARNGFYSCGLFIKRKAINKIIDFHGELFTTSIEKYWGVEDTFLGDVCYHLGLTCGIKKNISLHGSFDKIKVSFDAMKKRFELRSKLNVKW